MLVLCKWISEDLDATWSMVEISTPKNLAYEFKKFMERECYKFDHRMKAAVERAENAPPERRKYHGIRPAKIFTPPGWIKPTNAKLIEYLPLNPVLFHSLP